MHARKDAPPDMQPKDILVHLCEEVNEGTSEKNIPANLFNKTAEDGSYVAWRQPPSQVGEVLGERSPPRASVPDNGTKNPPKYTTIGDVVRQALEFFDPSIKFINTEKHIVKTRRLEDGSYVVCRPQVGEGSEEGSYPKSLVPDNGTENPPEYTMVGESLLQERHPSIGPSFDRQKSSSEPCPHSC